MVKVTQGNVARLAKVHNGTVSRILNDCSKETFNEETKQRVFQAAARLGYLHPAIVKPQRRTAPRKKLKTKALIKIRLQDGSPCSECRGEVVNISSTGMLLKSIEGEEKGLPLKPFYLEITLPNIKQQAPKLKARLVRCTYAKSKFGLGVQFINRLKNTDRFLN